MFMFKAARRYPGFIKHHCIMLAMLAALPSAAIAGTQVSTQTKVVSSVPGVVARATNQGRVQAAQPVKVTLWMNLRNKAAFDQRVAALYTPGSATYHKWLTTSDLLTYAPTAADLQTVREQLEKDGLAVKVDESDPFAIRAQGTAAQMEAAFGTELNNFETDGTAFRANATEAIVKGAAASLVLSVSGLDNVPMKPLLTQAVNARTGKPLAPVPLAVVKAASSGLGGYFTDKCFHPATTYTLGETGQLPIGVYFGNVYSTGSLQCAYNAAQMQAVYGLPAVYKAGFRGEGQTIVVVDAFGSPTLMSDANEFNKLNSLPLFTSSTLKIVDSDGQPLSGPLSGNWVGETSIDVEWAHAIAPAANIVVVATPSEDDQDFQYAISYATMHHLGGVISNSYGTPETEHGAVTLEAYNQVIEQAAATGIAVNYASGDHSDLMLGTPAGATLVPADTPYSTAVGGTSIGVPGGTGIAMQTGWGTNETLIAFDKADISDPPYNYGNDLGSGGGSSLYFAKPAWQKNLSGSYRLVPDVSLEADPLTGAVLVYTDPLYGTTVEAIGGTSLSTPMFSAFWALANQKAGHLLGQAAPIVSTLPSDAVTDIVPVSSPTNTVGTVVDSDGATYYSAAYLAEPLVHTKDFVSAIWPVSGEYLNLTFGTDSSLTVAPGWDDVTGYGTPNGLNFVTAAATE